MQLAVVFIVALLAGGSSMVQAGPAKVFKYPSAPLIPIAPIFEPNTHTRASPIARGNRPQLSDPSSSALPPAPAPSVGAPGISKVTPTSSRDPCFPSPCGPNTMCSKRDNNVAQCRCMPGFIPHPHTIDGCRRECERNADCPEDKRCNRNFKCEVVCGANVCSGNQRCRAVNHQASCTCERGFELRAFSDGCQKKQAEPIPPPVLDHCANRPCGVNALCRSSGNTAVCSCPPRHDGNPLTRCTKLECFEHRDCPVHSHLCYEKRCVDGCSIPNICGIESQCVVRSKQPICSCPSGRLGDPFVSCTQRICDTDTCGPNTDCNVRNNQAQCSCKANFIGNPLSRSGCRHECVVHQDCAGANSACQNNRCVNLCATDSCAPGAICRVTNGVRRCSCPENFLGNPYGTSGCRPECVEHDDCSSSLACIENRCKDPCTQLTSGRACGANALCRVDDHQPICSCPKDHTGHPFEGCRLFTKADLCEPNPCGTRATCTPGHDQAGNDRPVCTCPHGFIGDALVSCTPGECTQPNHCRSTETCYRNRCVNACRHDGKSVCGVDANCRVRNTPHVPVCSCPVGFQGNPLTACYQSPATNRLLVGRSDMPGWKRK